MRDSSDLERAASTQLMRMSPPITGLVFGLLAGLAVFAATNLLVIKGGEAVGPHLSLLGQFFLGYEVTFFGSIVGFVYASIVGFAVGWMVAALYNRFVGLRDGGREALGE